MRRAIRIIGRNGVRLQGPGARIAASLMDPHQRVYDAVRGAIITYGIAAYTYFVPRLGADPAESGLVANIPRMLIGGIALQLCALAGRAIVARVDRGRAPDFQPSPALASTLTLVVDGVTVLLFALATYGGILRVAGVLP